MAKNRRRLEGFPESFPSVLISVIEFKGDILSSKHYKGTRDIIIVLNKPAIKVIKAKITLYTLDIIGVSPVLNHTNLL